VFLALRQFQTVAFGREAHYSCNSHEAAGQGGAH
jgi:hypothetical protein